METLKVKDHSVTGEIFELKHDPILDMLITTPKPAVEELGRYYESEDYISHTDQRRSIFEKVYHIVRAFALKSKIGIINKGMSRRGRLLDIGAGTGDFLVAANADGWDGVGVEPNNSARDIATAKGVQFTDTTQAIADQSVDVITMWHVLEHVPDVSGQIAELKRLLKPDGKIIIAVPNYKSYDAAYYKEFWAAYDVPRHLSHFSQTSIARLFAEQNLAVVKHIPMLFDSFYVSMLSEKYKYGRIRLNAIFIGLKSNLKARKTGEYSSVIYVIRHQDLKQ